MVNGQKLIINHQPLAISSGGPGGGRTLYLIIANDAFNRLNFGPPYTNKPAFKAGR